MEGWKTKYGSILSSLALGLYAASELVAPQVAVWFKVGSIILGAVGGPMATIGIGHKLDKAKQAMEVKQ